jgi:O-antigen/teichoic acid export membrane protein
VCHIVILPKGWGVIGLSFSLLGLSGLRYICSRALLLLFNPSLKNQDARPTYHRGDLKIMFGVGSKLLVLSLLGYFLNNIGIFIIEGHFGISEVQKFNAISKVSSLVMAISVLIPQMLYPYIAGAWAKGDGALVQRYYRIGVMASMALAFSFCGGIVLVADWLMPIWLGPENYLGLQVLLPSLIYALIYVHHMAHATPTLACLGSGFIWCALVNVALAYPCILIAIKSLGIAGVPVGLIVAVILPSIAVVSISLGKVYRLKGLLPQQQAYNVAP